MDIDEAQAARSIPVIDSGIPASRSALPIAVGCGGLVLTWLTNEPTGLLVTAAAVGIVGERRGSLLSVVVFGLALVGFILAVGWGFHADRNADLRAAVVLVVGLGISALIYLDQAARSSGRDDKEARLIVESMPGHAWSADPNGKFIYVSPSTLKYLGEHPRSLDRVEGTDDFGWRQVVHPDDYDRIVARWLHSLRTGEPYESDHRIRRFDGTYRWFRNVGMPSRDSSGRITGWYGTTIDIHEQKTAELALREREQQLQQLVEAVPAMIWCAAPDGTTTYRSKRHNELTGVTLADMTAPDGSSFPLAVIAHPDDRAAAEKVRAHAIATGSTYVVRYRQRRRDGTYRWTESRAEPLRDGSGNILQWYGVSVDIDDLIIAQESLRERERQLQVLIDAIPAYVWCLTPEGAPSYFNKRVVDDIGLTVDGVAASDQRLSLPAVHPDERSAVRQALMHSLETGEPFVMKYRQRRAGGGYRWTEGRTEALRDEEGRIVQWYGVYLDIDDEVTAQQALRERERELQQLVDALPIHIWSWTPNGKLAYVNKRYLEHLGLSEANFEDFAKVVQELVHPEDAPEVQRTAASCLKTGDAFVMRYRRRGRDGIHRWVEGRCEPLRDQDGTVVHWYHVSIDIDDEMRAQQALRERERFLWQLVETLPAMIDCAAPNGEPIYRSQQLREFLGYELEELDGKGTTRLDGTLDAGVHPDDVAGVKAQYAHCLMTGEPYARRHRLRRYDGEYRWVETRAAPMRNAEGTILQWNVICLDIDGEVRTEEELRLAQEKMARASQAVSLAELSASIAHEVNQPLAAIVATSHACRRWLSANPPNLERAAITLERIIRDANSAADVVGRIRSLFSQMGKTRSRADITEVIREVCRLMADEVAMRRVHVVSELGQGLPPALIDRVQMQQVLVNLIRNAIDALDAVADGARDITICAARDSDGALRVEVRDLGTGVKEPERIFEPFFTTKKDGMGMGLSICRSIIEAHDGRLWAISNEPRGTTFVFTLPIQAEGCGMSTNDFIVFVVDDDVRMREALSELLESLSWQAVVFGSAGEYIAYRRPDRPACLILDVELPDINGLDFQNQISNGDHPPIVFLTGRGDIPSSVRAIKHGAVDFLTKPFTERGLLEAIRSAIELDRRARQERAEIETLRQRLASLTPRERDVLPLVVSGLLNKQAAAELGISEVTLQIHRSKIMQKMEAASLADLVRIAEKLRIPVTHSRRTGNT